MILVSLYERIYQLFFNNPLQEFIFNPERVKVTLWNYTFTSFKEFNSDRTFWNKKYIKEFLSEVDINMLIKIEL